MKKFAFHSQMYALSEHDSTRVIEDISSYSVSVQVKTSYSKQDITLQKQNS